MELTGKQKAAMLLMGLDTLTAAELLKGLDPEVVKDLAVELAYLDAAGFRESKQSTEITRQFCSSLRQGRGFHLKSFLENMLKKSVGEEKARDIQDQIQELLRKRDPFISIRSASAKTIALILESEHPQAIAVVLSELETKKSSEVLGFLSEGVRLSTVCRMARPASITAEAKGRIAQMVCSRFEAVEATEKGGGAQADTESALRKVAVILRNLKKELRDGLLGVIKEKDSSASEQVVSLMVVWEDIAQVSDRSLQEVLRGVDSRKLALALMKADEGIVEKIRSNISERASAAIDEEISLMKDPKREEVEEAREEIVEKLREMNQKGELAFIEG